MLSLQWLRKDVSNLILRRAVFECEVAAIEKLLHEEISDVDMLGPVTVRPTVLGHLGGRHVVVLSSEDAWGVSHAPASCMKFLRYIPRDALSDRVTNSDSHVDFVTMC